MQHFLEAAVPLVVLQPVCQVVRLQQVVDGDDLDVAAEILHRRAQHVAPDAAETVDTNLDRHVTLLKGKTGKTRKGKKHAILAVSRPRFHPRRAPSTIGRASSRERWCTYVWIAGVSVSLKKKTTN